MKKWLVTGGAGFIGSNFICRMLEKNDNIFIVNLDALTYAGNPDNLEEVKNNERYVFVHGNICDRPLVQSLFSEYDFDIAVNFAAESHVDRSIDGPEIFLKTNTMGTQVLLDCALNSWKVNPDDRYSREFKKGRKYIQISTDEVYGALKEHSDDMFKETTPLSPNSPYSASKASADMMVQAYHNTFGLPVNITRCSNNYGPRQYPEKLIPLMIQTALEGKKLPVYGDGLNIRDWIHVYDHCDGIKTVIDKGIPGEVYNIGGNNERTNIEIVRLILKYTQMPESLISYVRDRPGHDRRYAIDSGKIQRELGWKAAVPFESGIEETVRWYMDKIKNSK